jgi:hypothetical protein
MIHDDLISLAEAAGYEAVATELREAKLRTDAALLTEAIMRLGRATEATLYAAAREFGVRLHLHIPHLSDIQEKLRGFEARILKKSSSTDEVKKLSDISKQLSHTIALLMESESFREGTVGDRVRGNDSILNELIESIDDSGSKRRLGRTKELLQKIMRERNSGAHASPTGEPRETDPSVFPELAGEFQDFIRTIIEVAAGERSRRMMQPVAVNGGDAV